MNRRNVVRIVSFSVSVAITFALFSYKTQKENKKYILQLENSYSYMLDRLSASSGNIATLLNKARFATTSAKIGEIAAEITVEAQNCKNALSQLPVGSELEGLNRFYSQVGNYAMAVSKKLDTEKMIQTREIANIEQLSSIAKNIDKIVGQSSANHNNLKYWAKELESRVDSHLEKESLNAALGDTADEFKDYPTLIYDGPYSDHILEKEPSLLKDTADVINSDAHKTAALLANTAMAELDFAGETKGNIATFNFLGTDVTVGITKQGGFPLYMRKNTDIEEIKLSYEDCLINAHRFLNKIDMNSFKETYYFESDGICTINFAFNADGVVCYTDLVKVGVSMEDGDIVFYEAGGYISNHKVRSFKADKYSQEDAQKIISSKLTVDNVQKTLIPTDSVEEKLCFEFNCTSADGQNILVYINTATLEEEEILILLKSDGGTLVK